MVKPRFRVMVFVLIAALLIIAGYDISMRLSGDPNPVGGILVLSCFSTLVCGPFVLLGSIVFLASRGDPAPRSDSGQRVTKPQFKIATIMIIVLVVALVFGAVLWLVRNQEM